MATPVRDAQPGGWSRKRGGVATPVRDVQPGGCSRKRGGWLLQYETYSQEVAVVKEGMATPVRDVQPGG